MDVAHIATAVVVPLAWHDGGGWGDGWWVWRLAMFLLFFVLLFFIFFCFRRWGPWGGPYHPYQPTGMERARDILAERFARGEITGEEYRERLEQLR
jgi:putative membrane protein